MRASSRGRAGLLILDCDGVLVDSERIAARVASSTLGELGWQLGEDDVLERFLGCTDRYFAEEVERNVGRPLPDDWAAETAARYERAFAAELLAVPGVVAALDAVERLGVETCVASNGSRAKMRTTLRRTGLLHRFADRIFSAEDVRHGKPAPDLFLHAARRMEFPPGRCLVVEDSPPGVQAARAAGMPVLAYAGSVGPERLSGPGTVVFSAMAELPGLVRDRLRLPLPRS